MIYYALVFGRIFGLPWHGFDLGSKSLAAVCFSAAPISLFSDLLEIGTDLLEIETDLPEIEPARLN